MKLTGGTWSRCAALCGCGFLGSLLALNAASTNGLPHGPAAAMGAPLPVAPPLRSPVDTFRELLALTPVERRQSLSNRPPEVRKRILAKLREYESLKPDERELRLRATELQWYLLPLMSLPRTNRAARLAQLPDEDRRLVERRLNQWDLLPPPLQEQMLNNEMTARYFSRINTPTDQTNILARMSPERRAKLESGLERWRGLSEPEREKTLESFNAFFELTPREKQKALNTLSEAEQRQMDRTLQAYEKLPVAQRQQCIQSFEKFAGMSLAERQSFLKNAERWKLMLPAEREAWRKLVSFAPPLPPLPPLPSPRASPRRADAALAINH